MLDTLLANEMVINAVAGLVLVLLTALSAYLTKMINTYIKDEKTASQINEIVEDAVFKTFNDFVKNIKASSADGKLTAAERAVAMGKTKQFIMENAAKKGIDLGKTIAKEKITTLIESAVQRSKAGGFKLTGASIAEKLKARK